MTDKELKKLSRLELLELLLEVSNENEELKQKMEKMASENEVSKSIENLVVATKQVNEILSHANKLVETNTIAPENKKYIDKIYFCQQKWVNIECDAAYILKKH